MIDKETLERLIRHEGLRLDPYTDTKGNITGGVGHLFTEEDYTEFNPKWSNAEKRAHWVRKLSQDYKKAHQSALEDSKLFDVKISAEGLRVLTELKFNMGVNGFSKAKWPKLYAALNRGDYKEASRQLLVNSKGNPSQWALDVKSTRANEMANALRSLV